MSSVFGASDQGWSALDRLRSMARQRPVLAGGYRAATTRHETASHPDLDAWAEAMLRLANVNAGPGALLAAFQLAASSSCRSGELARITTAVTAAAEICRAAGARAACTGLEARLRLGSRLASEQLAAEGAWWRGLVRLAHEAPTCLAAATASSGRIVDAGGTEGFEAFVAAGLRAVRQRSRREAFFALEDPEALRILDRLSGKVTFDALQRRLHGFAAALWGGRPPPMRGVAGTDLEDRPQRPTVSSGIVRLPEVWRGVSAEAAPDLYKAAVAHATAHLALGGPRLDPGTLKPVQIVLVGLIEDARIETLAMRRFPGLFRLWAPFHTAEPAAIQTVPMLLGRLARALFDPAYADHNGLVCKGRALFSAETDLADPTLSRRIGGLLGNDIGQMRLQFNARLHVVEPAYRDDNLGLWTLPPPPPDAPLDQLDMPVDSARIERRPDEGETKPPKDADPEPDEKAGRTRLVEPDDRGVVVAHYPEWDRLAGVDRPDWVTVREVESAQAPTFALDAAMARDPGLQRRVERLLRAVRVGRATRLRRQPEGLDLDLDAVIDAAQALRTGEVPDERIHQRKVMRTRDLAVLVLVDVSESTRDHVPAAGARILDVERLAVAALGSAMHELRDDVALRAFASNGREEVRVTRIKDFGRPFDRGARERLCGLEPGLSTRLGAALRHAGAELGPVSASRRIVIALTDGAPSDIDVPDPDDLVDDARRAVLGLHGRGIDVFGITLDPGGQGAGAAVFGRRNHMPVRRIEELPRRLSELYVRLARG